VRLIQRRPVYWVQTQLEADLVGMLEEAQRQIDMADAAYMEQHGVRAPSEMVRQWMAQRNHAALRLDTLRYAKMPVEYDILDGP
jgi:hypothetical protein